jgi:hypothetical protein
VATNDVRASRAGPHVGRGATSAGPTWEVLALGAGLAAAATMAQSLLYLLNHFVLGASLFHEDAAASFERVAGGLAVAACAIAATVLAAAKPAERRGAAILAVLTLYFAIDKVFGVHERLARGILDALAVENVGIAPVWLVLYVPIMVLAAVLMLRTQDGASPAARRVTCVGVAALGAALVVQAGWVIARSRTVPGGSAHVVEVTLEEGLELAGWLLVATGLAAVVVAGRRRRA